MSTLNRRAKRSRVHFRIRKKISGTAARPRLAVFFSNQHVYAQLIDDEAGRTLAAASTTEKDVEATGAANVAAATRIGKLIAERAQKSNIENVVFDRGGFIFHGKVKALADAAREGGLKF
ncbi:50S ribosomal protein L18 [Sulfuriroseicoccus oceanibius]|uniref:Large ribosomal subunit protein uL18 n=1 Tax=Sulfuriroseicoccus oceanibius TaxID=2707525 RepID=A0A6B3LBZ5_9BACT|nr:50S ribosomal protein L18 [Sulfuriroseicoccus oceanibius]QQL45836.1 50S ribosomal protein L18 [Sulfuriroseicoccus oceanibius]